MPSTASVRVSEIPKPSRSESTSTVLRSSAGSWSCSAAKAVLAQRLWQGGDGTRRSSGRRLGALQAVAPAQKPHGGAREAMDATERDRQG